MNEGHPVPAGTRVYIGLGGNVGGDAAVYGRIHRAARALERALAADRVTMAGVYRSAPVGPVTRQPMFLNTVVSLDLARAMTPVALLAEILAIEAALGRVRPDARAQGPRPIDLDLLFAGDRVVHDSGPPRLRLPHPAIAGRAFVLRPLADLVGLDWRMPGIGRTVRDCLAAPAVAAQARGVTPYAPGAGSAGRCSPGVE